jgi:hypothetical protein
MKKLISFLIFAFCLNTSFGQILLIQDLLKIKEMSFDDFHEYVTSKKYKFYQIEDDETAKGFSYAFGQNRSNKYATRVISKKEYKKSKKQSVTYQMLTSGDYFNISNQLTSSKYQFVRNTMNKTGTKFSIYRKDRTEILLSSEMGFNPDGAKVMLYQVLVSGY